MEAFSIVTTIEHTYSSDLKVIMNKLKEITSNLVACDFEVASKWSDEDPNDRWYVGTFAYKKDDRFYLHETGLISFRNCRKITKEEGDKIIQDGGVKREPKEESQEELWKELWNLKSGVEAEKRFHITRKI